MRSQDVGFSWLADLPRSGPVPRERFLISRCQDKSVVHVGFVDYPLLDDRIARGEWLHAALAEVAGSIVGIDSDFEGVEWARAAGFKAHVADASSAHAIRALNIEAADAVIAGEVLEHLDAPGPFLRAMLTLCKPDGRLIVTTPNAYRALNLLVPLTGKELIHPDHVAWHSPATLSRLLRSSGWVVEEIVYYQNPRDPVSLGRGIGRVSRSLFANAVRSIVARRRWPYWCDGLIAVARPESSG